MAVIRPLAQPASATSIGSVRLSLAPSDPADPVVVGDNDPRLLGGVNSVALAPDTSARNIIASPTPDVMPLAVRGAPGQTASMFEAQDSFGNPRFQVQGGGRTIVYSGLGVNAASGSGSAGLSVKAATLQSGNLQEWQNSAGAVLSRIDVNGYYIGSLIKTNTLQDIGSSTNIAKFGAAAGTGIGAKFEPGQPTWTPVIARGAASQSVDLFRTEDSSGNVLTRIANSGALGVLTSSLGSAAFVATAGSAAGQAMVARAFNASQSGSMFEAQDSNGNPRFQVQGGGRSIAYAGLAAFAVSGSGSPTMLVRGASVQSANLVEVQDSVSSIRLVVAPDGSLKFSPPSNQIVARIRGQAATADTWQINQGGSMWWGDGTNASDILMWRPSAGVLQVEATGGVSAGTFRMKGGAGQTGDLIQAQNSGGTSVFKVGANGGIAVGTGGKSYINDNTNVSAPQGARFTTLGLGNTGPQSPSPILSIVSVNPADVPMLAVGTTAQTGDLLQFQNSANSVIAKVNSSGNIVSYNGFTSYAGAFMYGGGSVNSFRMVRNGVGANPITQWMDNGGSTQLSEVNVVGQLGMSAQAAPAAKAGWGYIYVATDGSLHYRGPSTDTQLAAA